MAKTQLLRSLRKAFFLSELSAQPGMPPADEIAEWYAAQRDRQRWSRREFLRATALTGAALGVASVLPPGCKTTTGAGGPAGLKARPTSARIVIVGGGIAGLYAGYVLKEAGLTNNYTIYEASQRPGGRMLTGKLFGLGGTTELGGEFIDSDHHDMLWLARKYGVRLLDKEGDTLEPELYFMNGQRYTLKDAIASFDKIRQKLRDDANSLGKDYDGPGMQRFDRMTLRQYIDGLPTDAWFKQMLDVAYVGEYGLDAGEQSAINLIDLVGEQKRGFALFGESDERYKFLGGNQQICENLARESGEKLQYGHKLTAVKNKGQGFTLTFDTAGGTRDVDADYVIMTLPFTVLRDIPGVLTLQGITEEKKKCIQELGYGTNGKIFLGMTGRPWRPQGFQGYLYTEKIHTGWDSYHLQNNNAGPTVYTVFFGGAVGARVAPDQAAGYAPQIDKAFHGAEYAFRSEQTAAMNWTTNALSKGSYICYKPGQWTTISGQEAAPIGQMLFAGEHCSENWAGFMNGAAETGRVMAERIVVTVNK